jgi:hypothetical protein
MALAFYLRRMEGAGWELAANDTAKGFNITGERAASRVERAAKTWRPVVVPFLMEVFPERTNRLQAFLRERSM